MRNTRWPTLVLIALWSLTLTAQDSLETIVRQRFNAAQEALSQGELDLAESEFREVLAVSLLQLGAVYLTLQEYSLSELAYREASMSVGTREELWMGEAIGFLRKGRYKRASQEVRKVLEASPKDKRARVLLAKL